MLSGTIASTAGLLLLPIDNWIMWWMLMYCGVVCPFVYPTVYCRAPSVGHKLQEAKRLWRYSFQTGGVRIGHFMKFEREFMLVYLDFFVNQLQGIVIGFRA